MGTEQRGRICLHREGGGEGGYIYIVEIYVDVSTGSNVLYGVRIEFISDSSSPQSSFVRQECLERDQRVVALLSRIRHVEVRLKQQQQSVGRGLVALDDVVLQTEVK